MAIGFYHKFGIVLSRHQYVEPYRDAPGETNAAIQVRVYPRWYSHVALDWSVPASWGDCSFNVYHSALESGEYEKINTSPVQGNCLIDSTSQEYSKFRKGYYVVEALLASSPGHTVRSKPATWQNKRRDWVELRARDIQRREFLLLRKFTGVASYLFKRRTYGLRCPACWDAKSETVTQDHCTVCFGTSFAGGYFPPIPLFVQYDSTPSSSVKTYFGKFEPSQISAWTVAILEAAPDDLVVRTGDWNVYKVAAIQFTELQAVPVRQIMQLNQLGRRDVENSLVAQHLTEFPVKYAQVPPAPVSTSSKLYEI